MRKPRKFYFRYATAENPGEVVEQTITAADPACALGLLLDESDESDDLQLEWVAISRQPFNERAMAQQDRRAALAQIGRAVSAGQL
jgi:hypothetical protein